MPEQCQAQRKIQNKFLLKKSILISALGVEGGQLEVLWGSGERTITLLLSILTKEKPWTIIVSFQPIKNIWYKHVVLK